ncbi:hypothetical protein EG68_11352 [Paragonimus skrjabini miyazakii]|uniref:Transmembrane protein 231 n=1 Tax=Paragonimus skrjabini miyazakii TaxID=59628 RepID=A0A8S9YB54_9TREM|nr:hypothetical protein EG68_11352 [Paragonimus skrjabini miyazakii]
MIRLHKFPELRRYHAPLNSTAFVLNTLIVMLVSITVPVLLVYFSYGFYIEMYTYYERPSLQFAGKLIAQVQTDKNHIYFTSITELSSQNLEEDSLIPTVSYEQSDDSSELWIDVKMSIPKAESVYAITMILLFETGLYVSPVALFQGKHQQKYTVLESQVPVLLSVSSPGPSSGLRFIGDLILKQNEILPTIGTMKPQRAYETADLSLAPKQLISKLMDNSNRTVCGNVEHRLLYWQPMNTQTTEFTTNLSFRLLHSRISVHPGLWFTVKFAWIQYLAVALPFLYAGEKLRAFVYGNQLVTTTVTSTLT